MGSSVTTILQKVNKKRILRKKTNELSTPLSIAIEKQQWSIVSVLIDNDPTALYQANIYRKMPLQTAIKLDAPHKILAKLVRHCARIQIPKPKSPPPPTPNAAKAAPPNATKDEETQQVGSIKKYAVSSLHVTPDDPINNPDSDIPPELILPTTENDPITFHYQHHSIGLLQLIMTTIKKESTALKLVKVVLDERRKLEVNRIKKIDKKNERIIKKNIKIKNLNRRNMKKMNIKQQCKNKVHKLEPLYDTTPTNPLLAEVSTHGNTPLHIAVVRCFAPEFQQLLIKVDNHGSHIDPKSNCCALRKSAKGKLPLHIACRGPFVGQNKVLYPFTIIEQLLQHAPESCKIPTNYGRLPLHLVLRAKANKSIVQLVLSSYPNAANVATKNGNYPLHIAIWNRASPSVIRMVLNHNKHASRIKSPSCSLYPIDMALEKCFGKKIISLLLRAACDAVGTNDTNDTNVTNVTNDINHSRVLSFRSQKRLKRLMPKLWLKCHATALVQTLARKKRQQTNYQKLKSSVSITQPWYRGVRVRKKNILIKKLRSIQTIQNTIRTYQAKKKKRRKQWAVTIVHQWIINFTWIQPTVVKNRQLTNEIVPDTTRVFFLDVYEAIAKRRISGVIIVQHLRNGYLSAKGQHGYKRAVNQVKLRHASATLINQTVKEWVCYQKMKRAFKPLLAFQCIRVWIRETPKLKFLRNKKLIRNVASTKIQSLSRGYVSRRNSIEIDSCIRIQAWFRCLSSWRKYRVKLHSAVQITKVQRALESRRKYWWIAKSPGLKRSRMFENQAKKVAYPQREGHHSNPPQGHYIPGNKHIFVNDKDRHEHKRLKLRMFLPTH